jgi:hypothetical protein
LQDQSKALPSTITAALAAGAPLICIPRGRDQPDNAKRGYVAAQKVAGLIGAD